MTDSPLKILMIGNSFSICVLKYMPEIARRLGAPIDLCSLYIGGCPLDRHCENISRAAEPGFAPYLVSWDYASLRAATDTPPFHDAISAITDENGTSNHSNIPAMLAADKWDIVTIQQASHKSWDPDSFHPYAEELVATIRKLAPQARVVIQETWSYCKGDRRICDPATGGAGSWGFDQDGMFSRLSANYAALAAKYHFDVIPTGSAIQRFRKALPVRELAGDVVGNMQLENGELVGDSIHLNRDGEYLQGCVWTAKLLGKDVESLDWAPDGDMRHPENAALIRRCAAEAVAGAN